MCVTYALEQTKIRLTDTFGLYSHFSSFLFFFGWLRRKCAQSLASISSPSNEMNEMKRLNLRSICSFSHFCVSATKDLSKFNGFIVWNWLRSVKQRKCACVFSCFLLLFSVECIHSLKGKEWDEIDLNCHWIEGGVSQWITIKLTIESMVFFTKTKH